MILCELKREYPEIMKHDCVRVYKQNVLESILSFIKVLITCFVPIINLGILYANLCQTETVKENTLNKIKNKIKLMETKNNENSSTWKNN